MEAITDDYYDEIAPNYLVKEYYRAIALKKELMEFISKNHSKVWFEEYRANYKEYMTKTIEKEILVSKKILNICNKIGIVEYSIDDRC